MVMTSLVVLLAVVVVGGFIGWRWTQGQYYVGADSKGQVVIYRGVSQRIAGISLSEPSAACPASANFGIAASDLVPTPERS